MKTIQLTQRKEAIVDDYIYPLLKDLKWYSCKLGRVNYVGRGIVKDDGTIVQDRMHWYVVGKPIKGMVIDHINGDGLDNRRENLRIVSHRENCLNRYFNRSGRLFGARFHKKANKWVSDIRINGKKEYLGLFNTENEAHEAYVNKLKEIQYAK